MKPLINLNNVERAKLLFELFPDCIPGSIQFIKAIADTISNNPSDLKQDWKENFVTTDFWIQLAKDTRQRIEKNGKELTKNSRRFSDQLFDGYNALFAVHCLKQFIKSKECISTSFANAVEMFFGYDV